MVCRFTHWLQDVGEFQWIAERIWVKWNLVHHFEIKLCWAEFAHDVVKIWFFRQFLSWASCTATFKGLLNPCRFVYKFVEKSDMQICVQVCGEIRYADLCDFCGETGYTEICVKFVERLNNLSSTFSCRLLVAALDMATFCFEVGNSYGAADDLMMCFHVCPRRDSWTGLAQLF